MKVNWSGYPLYEGEFDGPHASLDASQARLEHDRLLSAKEGRKAAFLELLSAHEVAATPEAFDIWFQASVEEEPPGSHGWKPGMMVKEWYSVTLDASLFFGDSLIDEGNGAIGWQLWKRRTGLSFNRTVITGFQKKIDPELDIDLQLGFHGHRVVAGVEVSRSFLADLLNRYRRSIPSPRT